MCWDNTFSHFNSKTVFFEIIVESNDDDDDRDPWDVDFENYDGLSPEQLYDMKIQDIQVRFCVNMLKTIVTVLDPDIFAFL